VSEIGLSTRLEHTPALSSRKALGRLAETREGLTNSELEGRPVSSGGTDLRWPKEMTAPNVCWGGNAFPQRGSEEPSLNYKELGSLRESLPTTAAAVLERALCS